MTGGYSRSCMRRKMNVRSERDSGRRDWHGVGLLPATTGHQPTRSNAVVRPRWPTSNQPSERCRYTGDMQSGAATSPARLGAAIRDHVGTLPKMGGGPSRDALPMTTMAVPLFTSPANCPGQANLLDCAQAVLGPMAAKARHGVGAFARWIGPRPLARCDAPCVLRHRRRMH